jgi:CAAX prenyl protease-like protein
MDHNRQLEGGEGPRPSVFTAAVRQPCLQAAIVTDSTPATSPTVSSSPQPLWAYVGPFAAYMVLTSIEGKGWLGLPYEAWYCLKVLVVLGLLWYFHRAWPRWSSRGLGWGVALGVLGVVVWLALDRLQQAIPGLSDLVASLLGVREGFNPFARHGVDLHAISFVLIRLLGLALVVPIMEEIFWRGFLARFLINDQFTEVPQGQFTAQSFAIVTAAFVAVHPELLAAAAWGALINWLYYKTQNVWACVVMHAVTNLLLGAWILTTGDWRLW